MDGDAIKLLVEKQRRYHLTGATRPYSFRLDALRRLKAALKANEKAVFEALEADLGKARMETYMSELGMALSDLGYAAAHLRSWMKVRRVGTPLAQFAGRSFVIPEPYGTVLIMAPWNYPLQLCVEPLCGALAAGNTVVLKPSAYAPATSHLLAGLVRSLFPPEHVAVVEGGREENGALLDCRFDYIFFTGSPKVGHLVMEKAAAHLTPVSLELGGKSPVVVDRTADLALSARRLAFGKFLNAGQTCVAPDYVLIDRAVKERFIALFIKAVEDFFPGGDFRAMPRIVNERHYNRIMGLLEGQKILYGGAGDPAALRISPTVVDEPPLDSRLMGEEIFAPVMPFIAYDSLDAALDLVRSRPKPLAMYVFTRDKAVERKVLKTCSFGGGCVNDTVIHLCSDQMGFGGVGDSGMGSYHGKLSFDTFTHYKSIMKKALWIDLPMRYHPYKESNLALIRKFMK